MRGARPLGGVAVLVGSLIAAGVVVGQTSGMSSSSLAARTEAVAAAVQVSQQFLLVLGTGLTLGLGLGAIVGSVSVYEYWQRTFSSKDK